MARQGIGTGSSPNDGTGDNLRTGAAKINDNFGELYTYFGDGTNLNFSGGVWNTVSAGINTLSSVGIGTTNPRFTLEVGAVGASGTSLYVNGDARVTGILTVGSSSISLNGSTNEITVGTGITISGNTGIISATQVNIGGEILTGAGVTSLVAGSNITLSGSTGQVTINSSGGGGGGGGGITTANIVSDSLVVSGVSTFNGGVDITGNIDSTNLDTGTGFLTLGNSSSQFDIRYSPASGSSPAIRWTSSGGISIMGRYNGGADLLEDVRFGDPSYFKNIIPKNDSTYNLGSNSAKWSTVYSDQFVGAGVTINSSGLTVAGLSTFSIDNSSKSVQFKNTGNTARVAINMADAQTPRIQFISSDNDVASLSGDSNANVVLAAGNTLNLRANTSEKVIIADGDTDIYASDVKKLTVNSNGINVVGVATIGAGTSTNGVDSPALTLSHNNPTVVSTAGTTGQIKQIGGQPYYYDGTTWRALFLVGAASTVNQADSDWDNTMIRMNFDQANIGAVTNLKDGRTPFTSQVDLVSSPLKYGTKTARLQVNNGGLKFTQDNSGSIYYPFEGAWTLEGWFYFNSSQLPAETNITNSPILFANWHPNTNVSRNWKIGYYRVNASVYNFYWYNKNSSDTGSGGPGNNGTGFMLNQLAISQFADDAWHHISIVRESGNGSIHFYLDGVQSTYTDNNELIDNEIYDIDSHSFAIGAYQLTGDTGSFEGNIDDIRISKSARYTSNFTPPTSALPITGSTTTVYEPADSKVGEISLGGSPAWTGTPGVTASQIAAGQYRATFATAYSNATDYVIQTSMNDYTPATTPVGIGVSRFTTHADFFVRRVSDGANIDTGSLAIDLFKK